MENPKINPLKRFEKFEGYKISLEVLNNEKKPPVKEAWIEYFESDGNLVGIIRPD